MQFLKLYLGRDDRYTGNSSACYRAIYNKDASDRIAQASGNRITSLSLVSAFIDRVHKKVMEDAEIDQAFVLEQSVILYDRSMGYSGVPVDIVTKDADGNETIETVSQRAYNPSIAAKALELIGKHTQVQAFQDNVKHTHTHLLEDKLSKRMAKVEARAKAIKTVETNKAIEHKAGSARAGRPMNERVPYHDDHPPTREIQEEKPALSSDGASA